MRAAPFTLPCLQKTNMSVKQILVIDDDDGVREIIRICLEAAGGWKAITAASGQEGLRVARSQQPDAILLDVMMPELDGLKTFRQLQTDESTCNIPTILLTAKAKASEKQRFLDLGVAGVITKPFEVQKLVEQMREILRW